MRGDRGDRRRGRDGCRSSRRGGPGPAAAAGLRRLGRRLPAPETADPSGQIPVGASPSAVAAGDGSIWVANGDAHSVSRIDPVKQVTIETIPVGNGPAGIAFGGGFVWVTNSLDGTVSRIDPQTNTEVQRIPVGNAPAGVAVDSRYVWVANSRDGTVTPIDRQTGKPLEAIPVGQSADGVAVGYGSVWVTSASSGSVTRIDARSRSVAQVDPGRERRGRRRGRAGRGLGREQPRRHGHPHRSRHRHRPRRDPRRRRPERHRGRGRRASGSATSSPARSRGSTRPANTVVRTVTTGNRPQGIVLDSGALFVAVRASGAGPPRRHADGADVGAAASSTSTRPSPTSYTEGQVVVLTNDGLTGFRRVGRQRRHPARARSRRLPSHPHRRRPVVQLPAAPGHPLLERGARAAAGLPPGDRAHARPRRRRAYAPYYAAIVGARGCLAAPKKPCDLSKGIVTDAASNTVTFHLTSPDPDFLSKLALPSAFAVPAGTPLHPRGSRYPPPARTRSPRSHPKRGIRLVRNPQVSRVVAGSPAERLPRRHRRAQRRLGRRERRPRSCAARPIWRRLDASRPPRPCSRP